MSPPPASADGRERRVYCRRGVGALRQERPRGGAFGRALSRNVLDACRLPVESYDPDDGLCLFFGFSRGAFGVPPGSAASADGVGFGAAPNQHGSRHRTVASP
ncbi:phospholipase effector Tle1 domain-containing protein [Streptomyces sp. SAI-229]|uniref:phospholipase effector Tle1 domain-containing protein n=1 Tax=Streptomyces sp. SAI-229 TaxID=3377731 RepID=UPI003C7D7084